MLKKWRKKLGFLTLAALCIFASFPNIVSAEEVPSTTLASIFTWEKNDAVLVYPADRTTATANSNQGGFGTNLMFDNKNDTRWEASWSGSGDVTLTFTLQEAELVSGFKYVSRQDNNVNGTMSKYNVSTSVDGTTYTPVVSGTLLPRIATEYITFDEPVAAKYVRMVTDARAISEMRMLYIPNTLEAVEALLSEAKAFGVEANGQTGHDVNLYNVDTLIAFDQAMSDIDKMPLTTAEEIGKVGIATFEAYKNLKRSRYVDTSNLAGQYNVSKTMLDATSVGVDPLTWKQEDIDAFRAVLEAIEPIVAGSVSQAGAVADAEDLLKEANYTFTQSQNKPKVTLQGVTTNVPFEKVLDGLTETRIIGTGYGENNYIELDYGKPLLFESLTLKKWNAIGNAGFTSLRITYYDEVSGTWKNADGKASIPISWTTHVNQSEVKTLAFTDVFRSTKIRIYPLTVKSGNTWELDELEIGIAIDENDMQISLDKSLVNLLEGESGQLAATVLPSYASNKNVIWKSENDALVSVSATGFLRAATLPDDVDSANVKITATTEFGGKVAECVVNVKRKLLTPEDLKDTERRVEIAEKLLNSDKEKAYFNATAVQELETVIANAKTTLAGDVTQAKLDTLNTNLQNAVDKVKETSTLAIKAVNDLIERTTGEGSSASFELELIPNENGFDVYEVDWNESTKKVVLRGNNGGSLATAYNYYLKYFAYLNFPYVGESELSLPSELPVVSEKVHIVFPYQYRHYFNENCEYKYTADLYTMEQWQHRIDWLAMNGFNMFLLDLGEQEIWMNAFDDLGITGAPDEAAILDELQRSNADGTEQYYAKYAKSIDAIEEEGNKARQIVDMAFGFGMDPEVRPYYGQVSFMFPNNHDDYYGSSSKAKMTIDLDETIFDGMLVYSGARWAGLPQGVYISPDVAASDAALADEMKTKYQKINDIYYASLQETLGFDAWGRVPAYGYKDMVGEQGFVVTHEAFPQSVVADMSNNLQAINPDAVWIQTSWRYYPWLLEQYKEGDLMFVDLNADVNPKHTTNNEFGQTQWIWGMLFNFGGNTGLGGGFDKLPNDVVTTKNNTNKMSGVGITPEGGDTNPAYYELMAEMTWRSEAPDMQQWIKDYTIRRYGKENYEAAQSEIDAAWQTLYDTVYSGVVPGAEAPAQTLVNSKPKFGGTNSRAAGTTQKVYQTQDILPAWENLLLAYQKMENPTPQFEYDLIDVGRQALGDISMEIYNKMNAAGPGDLETAAKYADMMVMLADDMDVLLKTNDNFLLGKRLEGAKQRGNETDAYYFEKMERTFRTYWILDSYSVESLVDYCNMHLSGLMSDYYGERWQIFADELHAAAEEGRAFNQNTVNANIKAYVQKWADPNTSDVPTYPSESVGDPYQESYKMYRKYAALLDDFYGYEISEPLDISALSDLIDEANAMDTTPYTQNSVNNMKAKVEAAQALLEDYTILQSDVDAMIDELQASIDALLTKADKSVLNTLIDEADTKVEETYTADSWDAFESALEAAQVVSEDANATQEQVNSAAEALSTAMNALEAVQEESVNTDALQQLISVSEDLIEEAYTPESWSVLAEALTSAKEVLANPEATQSDVDTATAQLQVAKDALVAVQGETVNTDALQQLISASEDLIAEAYTADSWNVFAEALASAKEVLVNPEATQADVDAATVQLQAAKDALVAVQGEAVNTEALQQLIKEIEALNANDYTTTSWKQIQEVLADAKEALLDSEASQADIDAQVKALQAAKDKLVKKVTVIEKPSTAPVVNGNGTTNTGDTTNVNFLYAILLLSGVVLVRKYWKKG